MSQMDSSHIGLYGLAGIPDVRPGDDLAQLIMAALQHNALCLQAGDVLVITQKVVSKAEGRAVALETVIPSNKAIRIAHSANKDPRLVEVVLQNSQYIVRQRGGVLITRTHHGWICANAGVDRSNVSGPEGEVALPLPVNPDVSAALIRAELHARSGVEDIAVIISDTHGRPWRVGTVNVAIGVAGMRPLSDLRGQPDMTGYILRATIVARADELAAAAGLVMGQAAERSPVVLIRGAEYLRGDGRAVEMQRPPEQDLFK